MVVPDGCCGYLYACACKRVGSTSQANTAVGLDKHTRFLALASPRLSCRHLTSRPVAVVFDGHSGHAASEWLRDKLYDVIRRVVLSEDGSKPPMKEGSGGGTEVGADGVSCPIDLQNHLAESFRQADSVLLAELEGALRSPACFLRCLR